ncbi:helicase-related protein [Nakamurella sp. A5-74]|uniref:Helicase-related protein n=1 Tax=Nakamurella sp. A5-74 TaxID=3158264 RepID=A0AAU8DR97_9ACTN
MELEELRPHQVLRSVLVDTEIVVRAVERISSDAVRLTYATPAGAIGELIAFGADVQGWEVVERPTRGFDASAEEFRLVAEAWRIRSAASTRGMGAVTSSEVEPLPHQIRAVYGPLIEGAPLRFLLADDPGAGKTIMAGLYIKELILRDDVRRCLIVAPGGLVEQWQDELREKFGLRFEILSATMAAEASGSVFEEHPLVIARMDQLVRNERINADLDEAAWDLVVVDEAHRMAAHYYGGEVTRTKRFELGERLAERTRHLLLMTATPHAGKEEDFQLFLTLLDPDRFAGAYVPGVHDRSTDGLMRRMIKEDLLTFEGTPLFPERIAQTVRYELTDAEAELYESVTTYVRTEMNRAQRLDDGRARTVGFALTVLQRRLASSPEAIMRSLERRVGRLERLRADLLAGVVREPMSAGEFGAARSAFDGDADGFTAAEVEEAEDAVVDAATAARTAQEVEAELMVLRDLAAESRRVRDVGTDRKWGELRTILDAEILAQRTAGGADEGSSHARKIIVFTEHRDTLEYLRRRIVQLLGDPVAVEVIHGGVSRPERRRVTAEFTHNPECRVLVATDAAGEGLNLQVAHLMVNYDLPWNPNRLEQRFGRIHRIGQREVCRLWNLVAVNTREGEVFDRLLEKIDEQRIAYGSKVFDVLGAAFAERPLRELLLDAIQYGDRPEVRARMHQQIDASVAAGLAELVRERSIAAPPMSAEELERMRREMAEAKGRKLEPFYIAQAFRGIFGRLGGRLVRRESGRFEITHVPAALRAQPGRAIASRFERVTFDQQQVAPASGARAELLAPGHPLHDEVLDTAIRSWGSVLERGTVLVSEALQEPRLLVGVRLEVVDQAGSVPAVRFGYLWADADGRVEPLGDAPYLDLEEAADSEPVRAARSDGRWTGVERAVVDAVIGGALPEFLAEIRSRRLPQLQRTREAVTARLSSEVNRLTAASWEAADRASRGLAVRETPESLQRKGNDLDERLRRRSVQISAQEKLTARSPRVVAAALVVPASWENAAPQPNAVSVADREAVDRRGVDAVLAAERALGAVPEEQAHHNKGYDVLSFRNGRPIHIEVKSRIAGSTDFSISHTQVIHSLNMGDDYRLALVRVDPRGPDHDEVHYLERPFAGSDFGAQSAYEKHVLDWKKTWERGGLPF